MIDFRYHLVSLVAVFMALAVGIALGAGPLREGIADTLEGEVSQLRTERAQLRTQLDASRERDAARDLAMGTVTPRVLSDTLTGRRVGVVVLPGADRNTLDEVERNVRDAGGELVLTVELDRQWEAAGTLDQRLGLAQELAPLLAAPEPRDGNAPTLRTILAAALAGADATGHPGGAQQAARQLEDAGYAQLTWNGGDAGTPSLSGDQRPDGYLVLSGGQTAAQATGTGEPRLEGRVALVDALAGLAVPTVVLGAGGDADPAPGVTLGDPLVSSVRADRRLRAAVSTVDDTESATGRLAAVMAMAWQLRDQPGHYGTLADADAPVPAPPPLLDSRLPGEDRTSTAPVPDGSAVTDGATSTGTP